LGRRPDTAFTKRPAASEDHRVKHLTAERLLRLQDRSTAARFQAALDDWKKPWQLYRWHLERIAPKLPGSLRRLIVPRNEDTIHKSFQ
jgi:hypothetical protein